MFLAGLEPRLNLDKFAMQRLQEMIYVIEPSLLDLLVMRAHSAFL
jgi:hypothetical protein